MTKIVELRQDRSLIRSNFDGYKLSLDAVPVLRQELTASPHKAEPSDEQYSLLHAELFSLQNLLYVDPWSRNLSFYVNRLGEIVRSAYDENTGRPEETQVVHRLSADRPRCAGAYNYSMRFISEKLCVLCDGINQLLLLDTGDRIKAAAWQQLTSVNINEHVNGQEGECNFMLYDCRLDVINAQKQISCALGRVQRLETADGNCSHTMHLHWSKWLLDGKTSHWNFNIIDTLEGKGSLYYCAFEPRAESLIISANHEFNFRSQIKATQVEVEETKQPQLHDNASDVSGFAWTQTDEDVVVKFDMRAGMEKTDYVIKCTHNRLTVKCKDELMLDHELNDRVDQDLTTWSIENNFLQVTLIKENCTGLRWTSLISGVQGPAESAENGNQSCLPMEQQPIANLEAPIEDCDFPIGDMEHEITIVRFNLATKTATHTVMLGATPPLFATTLRPGFPAAFATRQDVDACLWLQQYNTTKPNEWSLRHEGNLHAFGYIQASKLQKKFVDCSPDLNYALICESHRHIFLYRSNYDTANGLRNRSGPQVTIGKQHLITLEDCGEVLGVATSNSVVTLLTEQCILYLQIN